MGFNAWLMRSNSTPAIDFNSKFETQGTRCKSESELQIHFADPDAVEECETVSSTPDEFTYIDVYKRFVPRHFRIFLTLGMSGYRRRR